MEKRTCQNVTSMGLHKTVQAVIVGKNEIQIIGSISKEGLQKVLLS